MRRSHSDPEIEAYIRKAERDLATAGRMRQDGEEFADIVCFHAQQCAEKALEGLILALGAVPPRTHDLGVLLRSAGHLGNTPAGIEEPCLSLTDFGVAPQYPGWEDVTGEVDLEAVVDAAASVLAAVVERLELGDSAE